MFKSQLVFVLLCLFFVPFARASVLLPLQDEENVLIQRADSGDANAAFELASFYEQSGKKGYPEIVLWLRRAANKDNLEAQFALGKIYHFGKPNVLRNLPEAEYWYERAAKKGDKQALEYLNVLRKSAEYRLESSPDIDEKWEMQWIVKTASYGDKQSQFDLGRLYEDGKKIEMDYRQALKWYEKSAIQGHIEAMFRLANLYLSGKGVSADAQKALFWYEQAALRDYVPAQRKLFEIYSDGENHVPDLTKAAAWLYISLKALFPDEKDLTVISPELTDLFAQMTEKQKEDALYFAYSYMDKKKQ